MEHNVVLADEVYQSGFGVFPPCFPTAQFGTGVTQFLGVTDVADGRVEPYVQHLSLSAFHRHGDTPVQVACYGTGAQSAVQPALALAVHVGTPFLVLFQNPLLQPFLVFVQGQIPVLCLAQHQGISGFGVIGIDQFFGAECGTAGLALVTVSLGGMATGAFAADVAVGKEVACLFVIELLADLFHQFALVIQFLEEVAGQLVMSVAGGAAIDIEADAEALEGILDERVVAVHHLLHGDAFLAGTDGNGNAMLVASANEKHIATLQAQITHINVCGDINSGQVAYVYGTIGIRQCRGHGCSLEILFHILKDNYTCFIFIRKVTIIISLCKAETANIFRISFDFVKHSRPLFLKWP